MTREARETLIENATGSLLDGGLHEVNGRYYFEKGDEGYAKTVAAIVLDALLADREALLSVMGYKQVGWTVVTRGKRYVTNQGMTADALGKAQPVFAECPAPSEKG